MSSSFITFDCSFSYIFAPAPPRNPQPTNKPHDRPEFLREKLGAVDNGMHQVPSATTARHDQSLESFIVGQHSGVSPARGYPLCSRKCSHVDDYRRVEVTSGVGNAVAQNQASLGVSVVDLHLEKLIVQPAERENIGFNSGQLRALKKAASRRECCDVF